MGLRDVGKTQHTTDVKIHDPRTRKVLHNADGTPITVTVHGPYSPVYRKASHDMRNRMLEDLRANGASMTAEMQEEQDTELLISCIEDWNLTLDSGPKAQKISFSPETAREVFAEHPWFREQIDRAFADVRAFLGEPKGG